MRGTIKPIRHFQSSFSMQMNVNDVRNVGFDGSVDVSLGRFYNSGRFAWQGKQFIKV